MSSIFLHYFFILGDDMISNEQSRCPNCDGELKYYDKVKRIVRTKNRKTFWVVLRRFKCIKCHKIHREIPDNIFPYKQYEAEVIKGVLEGFITPNTLGFEDYPCEMTMSRWIATYIVLTKSCF